MEVKMNKPAEQLTEGRVGGWINTVTGGRFYPLDPKPEEVNLVDVAHHLATTNRFNGALETPVNVADHSLNVHALVKYRVYPEMDPALELAALFHDSEEAYFPDVSRPLKSDLYVFVEREGIEMYEPLRRVMLECRKSIFDRFDIPWPNKEERDRIKAADDDMLVNEAQVYGGGSMEWDKWGLEEPKLWDFQPTDRRAWMDSKRVFLCVASELFTRLRALRGLN